MIMFFFGLFLSRIQTPYEFSMTLKKWNKQKLIEIKYRTERIRTNTWKTNLLESLYIYYYLNLFVLSVNMGQGPPERND